MKKEVEYQGKMVPVVTEFHDKYAIKTDEGLVFIFKDSPAVESMPNNSLEDFMNSNVTPETMKIKQNENNIKSILTESVIARESDYALYKFLLVKLGIDPKAITADALLIGMYKGLYPSWESVGRCRRKLQEDNPELRGSNWDKRHKEQDAVRSELGYIPTPDRAPGMTP